jgi:hypothetical protein
MTQLGLQCIVKLVGKKLVVSNVTPVNKKRVIGVNAKIEKLVILHAVVLQSKMQVSRQL